MTLSKIGGFDAGNSETTFMANGRTLTIPSFIGSGSLGDLARIRASSAGAEGALEADEYVLEHGGRSYFVGRLALEQAQDASAARGDVTRYWSGHTLRLLLTVVAATFKTPTVAVRLVTGLPVQVWSKETARFVRESLVGQHQFKLNGQERTVVVEGVLVVMEGAGALAVAGMREKVQQAVIDIGGRTTDLFWTHGQQPVMPRCTGTDIGVERIGDELKRLFADRHGRDLRDTEVREILRAYAEGRQPDPIYVRGNKVQLNGEVEQIVQGVGQQICSFVSQHWRSSERGDVAADAAVVLLIGGGAYYFRTQIETLISQLKVPIRPEVENARGYAAIGNQVPEQAWQR